VAGFCRAAWDRLRKISLSLWNHRTTSIGVVGMSVATAESWLEDHPAFKLPHRGTILLAFGAIVTAIGLYNKVREFLAARDSQDKP
jgi:hypothetical protein